MVESNRTNTRSVNVLMHHLVINAAIFVSLLLPRATLQAAEHCLLTQIEVKHKTSDWIQQPSPYNPCPSEVEISSEFAACLDAGQ